VPRLDPGLLEKLLQLVSTVGSDKDLPPSIANPLRFSAAGSSWQYRLISTTGASGTSGPVHFFGVDRGTEPDLFFAVQKGGYLLAFRVHRNGGVVEAIFLDKNSDQAAARDTMQSNDDLGREFEFWAGGADWIREWHMCQAELAGAHPVSPEEKAHNCTLVIESGKAAPGDVAVALVNRSRTYEREDTTKVLGDLKQALAADPESAFVWAELCWDDNWLSHDFEKAMEDCTKAIELAPNDPHGWTARGDVHLEKRDYNLAIEDYDTAIVLAPTWMWPLDNRGEAYLHMGQIERAIQDFNAAIRVSPDYAMGFLDRGIAEIRQKNLASAMSDFEKGIEIDAKCASCFVGRGIVERMRGKTAEGDGDIAKGKAMNAHAMEGFVKDGIAVPRATAK
jgi:tetratricopeptide (TPR) repeat protein